MGIDAADTTTGAAPQEGCGSPPGQHCVLQCMLLLVHVDAACAGSTAVVSGTVVAYANACQTKH